LRRLSPVGSARFVELSSMGMQTRKICQYF
jgi:hypothetical protein